MERNTVCIDLSDYNKLVAEKVLLENEINDISKKFECARKTFIEELDKDSKSRKSYVCVSTKEMMEAFDITWNEIFGEEEE